MTNCTDYEEPGTKAFTWVVIAALALLMVEVTWPQAIPSPSVTAATMTNLTSTASRGTATESS